MQFRKSSRQSSTVRRPRPWEVWRPAYWSWTGGWSADSYTIPVLPLPPVKSRYRCHWISALKSGAFCQCCGAEIILYMLGRPLNNVFGVFYNFLFVVYNFIISMQIRYRYWDTEIQIQSYRYRDSVLSVYFANRISQKRKKSSASPKMHFTQEKWLSFRGKSFLRNFIDFKRLRLQKIKWTLFPPWLQIKML